MNTKAIFDLILCILVPLVSICLAVIDVVRDHKMLGIVLLYFISLIIAANHDGEMLLFKKFFVIISSFFAFTGFIFFLYGFDPNAPLLGYFFISSLGMCTLWIPEVMRGILYFLGLIFKTKELNVLDSLSLMVPRIPWQIIDLKDSILFSFVNHPKRFVWRNTFNGEIVLSLLIEILKLTHNLAAATVTREYRIQNIRPQISKLKVL